MYWGWDFGQIVVQLLINAGCRVIGLDIDPRRIELAKKLGAKAVFNVIKEDPVQAVLNLTDFLGQIQQLSVHLRKMNPSASKQQR